MKWCSLFLFLTLLFSLAGCAQPVPATPSVTPLTVIPTLPLINRSPTPATPSVATATLAPTPNLPPTPSGAGSPSPSPTLAPTSQPPTSTPSAVGSPTRPPASPTAPQPTAPQPTVPQPSPVPTSPAGFPQKPEEILIQAPGLISAIVSPVTISGQVDSTFEQNLVAKVVGENGLLISSKATTIQSEMGKRGDFSLSLPFSVARQQPGRVAVYSTSPMDGGLVHFSSVEVTLKPGGTASLQPGKQQNEILVITQPAPVASISGGKLHVEGWSGPVFENAVVVILCGEGGSGKADPFCGTADNVLARVPVTIRAPDVGQPGPFSVDLTYKVSRAITARVAVYFTSARDGGLLHLASIPVRLSP